MKKEELEYITEFRRSIHENPELSGEEWETSKRIQNALTEAGIPFQTGFAKTGVLGIIEGKYEGPTVALRADIDALPIFEKTDISFRSKKDGVMHACGHDAHTSMLLGAGIQIACMREKIAGKVLLVFQPAEEQSPLGGAQPMLDDGIFAEHKPDVIFGQHVWPALPVGQIGVCDNEMMGASDTIRITVVGAGGHASMPHEAKDAIVIATELISSIQTIISRNTDPLDSAVVTIGTIQGGYRYNVIADEVRLEGTVRTYRKEVKENVKKRLEELTKGFAIAYNAKIHMDYQDGYDATVNTPEWASLIRAQARKTIGKDAAPTVNPSLGGEDFSRFLKVVPGAFYWLGCGAEDVTKRRPLHDANFYFDEKALPIGVNLLVDVTLQALEQLKGE